MASPKVESKKQVTYTQYPTTSQKVDTVSTAPLLSFKNIQNEEGLTVEHTSKLNQQYVKSHVTVKSKDGKTYNFNKTLENRINNVTAKLQKAEKENGLIGKVWSWTKNTIGFGDSSDKVREIQASERKLLAQFNTNEQNRPQIFLQLTGCEYTEENLENFIKGQIKLKSEIAIEKYKEGQDMAVDIASDIISGVVAYGSAALCIAGGIAAAPFTAGASLGAVAVGVGIAAGAGAITKVAIKGGEAAIGGKEYSLKQAGKDAIIGAVSGALAPITSGAGGAVANSVGKVAPKFVATTARLSVEGATFGAADGGVRSALEGDSVGDIALNTLKGAGVGVLAGNVLGHGSNAVGKGVQKVYEKLTPVYHGNGFTYRITPFGKKYKLQLDKPDLEQIDFNLQSTKIANPHPTNLTNELERVHYGKARVEKLFQENPNLSPVVGSLPQKWGKTLASKQGLQQVDDIFYNLSKLYSKNMLTHSSIKQTQENLSQILGRQVNIDVLGAGQIGITLKISVDNQRFVLKCFRPIKDNWKQHVHGNYPELASAVYASKKNSGHFANFYMGRFGKNDDGYMLTKFIDGKFPTEKSVHDFSFRSKMFALETHDVKAENFVGKTLIDYGATESTEFDIFTYKERKILRQLSETLDNKDYKTLDDIIAKYNGTSELSHASAYIQQLINNYSKQTIYGDYSGKCTIEYFIERQQLLNKLGINSVPNIGTINTGPYYAPPCYIEKYYDLSFSEIKRFKLIN